MNGGGLLRRELVSLLIISEQGECVDHGLQFGSEHLVHAARDHFVECLQPRQQEDCDRAIQIPELGAIEAAGLPLVRPGLLTVVLWRHLVR